MFTVAGGVAFGSLVGVMKVLFNLSLLKILVPMYILALCLSYGQDDLLVGIAWDAAGEFLLSNLHSCWWASRGTRRVSFYFYFLIYTPLF